MHKAIFIDKDNTIIKDVPYNVDPKKIALLENAGEGLRLLSNAGFRIIVVTDQSGVARGYFKEEDLGPICDTLQQLLKEYGVSLEGFYYCPHHPEGKVAPYNIKCNCRKPGPEMILKAAKDFNINLSKSWTVGDLLKDVEAGNRAGTKTALIDNGGETEWQWQSLSREPDIVSSDLVEAAKSIILFGENKELAYGQ